MNSETGTSKNQNTKSKINASISLCMIVKDEEEKHRYSRGRPGQGENQGGQDGCWSPPHPDERVPEASQGSSHRQLEAPNLLRVPLVQFHPAYRPKGQVSKIGVSVKVFGVSLKSLPEAFWVSPVESSENR